MMNFDAPLTQALAAALLSIATMALGKINTKRRSTTLANGGYEEHYRKKQSLAQINRPQYDSRLTALETSIPQLVLAMDKQASSLQAMEVSLARMRGYMEAKFD